MFSSSILKLAYLDRMPTRERVIVGYFAVTTLSYCRFSGLRDSNKGFSEKHYDTYAQYNYHAVPPRFCFSPTGRLATLRLCNHAHYTTAGLRIFVTSASGKYAKGIGAPFVHPPPC